MPENGQNVYKLDVMKRCNCHPPKPTKPIPGPVQHTGSSLYPDVGPRPLPPCPPMHPRPPVPVPEPCPVNSMLRDIDIVGIGDVVVTKIDEVYTKRYEISYEGPEQNYEFEPYTLKELNDMFDVIDDGSV